MVRYPKKITPYIPLSTNLLEGESDKKDVIHTPDSPKNKKSPQEILSVIPDHDTLVIPDASSELTDIKKTLTISRWKKFLPFIVVIVILIFILSFIQMKPKNLPITATIGIVIQPDNMAFANSYITQLEDVQRSLKLTNQIVGKVWMQISGFSAIWQQQQWLVNIVGKMQYNRVSLTKHPNPWGVILEVKDNQKERAALMATALIQEFKQYYIQERNTKLNSVLVAIKKKINIEEKRLNRILNIMESYVLAERGIVVPSAALKVLETIVLQRSTFLEEEYSRLKADIEIFSIVSLSKEKEFNWVVFQGLYFRLIDLELMKHAIPNDSKNMFDGGIQTIKLKIAQMIQELTERNNSLDANLIIKAIFVNAKLEAVDALRSKRVGVIDSFQGRRLEFIHLKLEYDQRFMSLENLNIQQNKIEDLLKKDLSNEMKIDVPLNVKQETRK